MVESVRNDVQPQPQPQDHACETGLERGRDPRPRGQPITPTQPRPLALPRRAHSLRAGHLVTGRGDARSSCSTKRLRFSPRVSAMNGNGRRTSQPSYSRPQPGVTLRSSRRQRRPRAEVRVPVRSRDAGKHRAVAQWTCACTAASNVVAIDPPATIALGARDVHVVGTTTSTVADTLSVEAAMIVHALHERRSIAPICERHAMVRVVRSSLRYGVLTAESGIGLVIEFAPPEPYERCDGTSGCWPSRGSRWERTSGWSQHAPSATVTSLAKPNARTRFRMPRCMLVDLRRRGEHPYSQTVPRMVP